MNRPLRFGFLLDAAAVLALAAAALSGFGTALAAGTASPFAPFQQRGISPAQTAPATRTLHGTVQQTAPAFVLRVNGVNTTLSVTPGATITRNGKVAPLSGLKRGDSVDA